jgi:nitrate reductase beta subunit
MANISDEKDLYEAQLEIFLDPHDKAIQKQAKKDGVPDSWMEAAKNSPVYKMAIDWKVAFPLHPEYRTLPMVWYVPPLSPIQNAIEKGVIDHRGPIPNVEDLRIPVRYLANMLTAGNEEPIILALKRMIAMRNFMRGKKVDNAVLTEVLNEVGIGDSGGTYQTIGKVLYSGCNGNATFQSIAILYTGEFLAASIQLSGTPSFLLSKDRIRRANGLL